MRWWESWQGSTCIVRFEYSYRGGGCCRTITSDDSLAAQRKATGGGDGDLGLVGANNRGARGETPLKGVNKGHGVFSRRMDVRSTYKECVFGKT